VHHLPQGAGKAEDPSSFGAADAEPGRRGEGEVPIRGVPILDPLEVKHPVFFRVSQVQNANILTQNDAPEVVKRSIVYPNYPTSSMSFILQVVNILVYLPAFICIYGISEPVRAGNSSRNMLVYDGENGKNGETSIQLDRFSASHVESLPWNGWNIENDDYYDNL